MWVNDAEELALLLASNTDCHGDAYCRHTATQIPGVVGDGEDEPRGLLASSWAATTRRLKICGSELVVMRPKRWALPVRTRSAARRHQYMTKSAVRGMSG